MSKQKGEETVQRYLYVMLSRTETGMGKMIRYFTSGEYNHVSLTLDHSFGHFVSFARYRMDVPLAGGYVREPSRRLLSTGKRLQVRIFRLPISEEDTCQLEALFKLASNRKSGLIYNSFGAFFSTMHIPCPVPGAYTCLDFAGVILGCRFPSLRALGDALSPWEVFQGDYRDIAPSDETDDTFFLRRGFVRGLGDTGIHFSHLLLRLLRLKKAQDPLRRCQLNILEKSHTAASV